MLKSTQATVYKNIFYNSFLCSGSSSAAGIERTEALNQDVQVTRKPFFKFQWFQFGVSVQTTRRFWLKATLNKK